MNDEIHDMTKIKSPNSQDSLLIFFGQDCFEALYSVHTLLGHKPLCPYASYAHVILSCDLLH